MRISAIWWTFEGKREVFIEWLISVRSPDTQSPSYYMYMYMYTKVLKCMLEQSDWYLEAFSNTFYGEYFMNDFDWEWINLLLIFKPVQWKNANLSLLHVRTHSRPPCLSLENLMPFNW